METCFAVCPKCSGRGFMKYKVWRSVAVLHYLCSVKMGDELGVAQTYIIRITCPGCDGSGIIDWVRRANRGETLIRPFVKPEGNMDIYLRPTPAWSNSPTKSCRLENFSFSARSVEKILELSRVRYSGIRLTPRLSALSLDELRELHSSLSEYEGFLVFLPDQEVTEERIKAELTNRGLADFMPDKFAYPGPDDFPR
jgi:hypothetical protein